MPLLSTIPATLAVVADGARAAASSPDMEVLMKHLVLQLAVILAAARLTGLLCRKLFNFPAVLGELVAGMIIGPYALGRLPIPGLGPMFPIEHGLIPVSAPLYGFATIASILLLFLSGLETDLATFLRYSLVGTAVGIGGVIFSFGFGAGCAVFSGLARSFMDPAALVLGAISTATSVGITARILSEKRKTDSPEGVTILAGAVLDDVLGIVVLAVVVGMSRVHEAHGSVNWGHILAICGKAIGFWLALTVLGLVSARRISRVLKAVRSSETIAAVAMGLALLLAGVMESAGLAMIIGAYVTGLSLSRTDLVNLIHNELRGAYNMLVPVFFCVMGMLVDFHALKGVFVFGLVYTVFAILAKVVGCGLPAWIMQFNLRGAYRIGVGMVPRGEVALIIASIGLAAGAISSDVFSASIMMTMLTTVIAPPLLAKAFDGGTGLKRRARAAEEEQIRSITLEFPSPDLADFMLGRLTRAFRAADFFVYELSQDPPTHQVRKDDMVFTLVGEGPRIVLTSPGRHENVARLIALEELLVLQDLAAGVEKMRNLDSMKSVLAQGMFDEDD